MSEDLLDEVTSLNSIYGDSTLVALTGDLSSSDPDLQPHIYSFTLPSSPNISLRVDFSPKYPDVPPSILGTQSVGSNVAKGDGAYLVELVREVLGDVYVPGAPVIFDVVEEVGTRLQQLGLVDDGNREGLEGETAQDAAANESNGQPNATSHTAIGEGDMGSSGQRSDAQKHLQDGPPNASAEIDGRGSQGMNLSVEPPWVMSETVSEKKSVFVARAAQVTSIATAHSYLQHLLSTDKKVARATHNITAWRIRGANGIQYQDCDDDGESAAGGRVLKLLELMGVWDCMVVVTRWYGGILLGADRFKIINAVAREAVVKGGFLGEGGPGADGQGGKGKGKSKKK